MCAKTLPIKVCNICHNRPSTSTSHGVKELGCVSYFVLDDIRNQFLRTRQSGHMVRTDKDGMRGVRYIMMKCKKHLPEKIVPLWVPFSGLLHSVQLLRMFSRLTQMCDGEDWQLNWPRSLPTKLCIKNASFRLHPSEVRVEANLPYQSQRCSLYSSRIDRERRE